MSGIYRNIYIFDEKKHKLISVSSDGLEKIGGARIENLVFVDNEVHLKVIKSMTRA